MVQRRLVSRAPRGLKLPARRLPSRGGHERASKHSCACHDVDAQVDDTPSPPAFPGTINRRRQHRRALASSARRSARRLLQDNTGENAGIMGLDDRVFRSSSSGFPAQSILWLRFQDSEGGNYICSSALIAPTVVLTAGESAPCSC